MPFNFPLHHYIPTEQTRLVMQCSAVQCSAVQCTGVQRTEGSGAGPVSSVLTQLSTAVLLYSFDPNSGID